MIICCFSSMGWTYTTTASWYGPGFHGRLAANGKPYNMFALTAAHKTLPFGTKVKITNLENKRSVKVVITDRGPYIYGREFDLSYKAALVLGLFKEGVGPVKIKILGKRSKFYSYRVRKGNTLWKLFGPKWITIAWINNITPIQLKAGTKIIIPYDWEVL